MFHITQRVAIYPQFSSFLGSHIQYPIPYYEIVISGDFDSRYKELESAGFILYVVGQLLHVVE